MWKHSKARDRSTPSRSKPWAAKSRSWKRKYVTSWVISELTESPDEAAQIGRLVVDRRKDLESAQARVQQSHFAIQTLTAKIANNERLREEVAQHKAEEALYRDLGTG